MSTSSASSTLQPSSSSTAPPAASSSSGSSGGDSGKTKPFLFFVALGFGVVFTNLWIIVGVKYCFRYNHRARMALLEQENAANGIDMTTGPAQRRRRREKKLMTMEEVNDRFPLTKYKVWRANREQEGLPSTGGITAPPSRAGSIKDAAAAAQQSSPDDNLPAISDHAKASATVENPASSTTNAHDFAADEASKEKGNTSVQVTEAKDDVDSRPAPSAAPAAPSERPNDDGVAEAEDEEDDPIRGALPDAILEQTHAGDNCAICIDSLDEDDEVRGLTCGHAFHAACVDPWLTSRRACCPLCKHDYYVPKPPAEGADQDGQPDAALQMPMPILSRPYLFFGGFRSQSPSRIRARDHANLIGLGLAPPTRGQVQREARLSRQQRHEARRQRQQERADQVAGDSQDGGPRRPGMARRFGNFVSTPASWIPGRSRSTNESSDSNQPDIAAPSTPRQLEAGVQAH